MQICRLGKGTFQIWERANSKAQPWQVPSEGQQGSQCGHSGVRHGGPDALKEERHGYFTKGPRDYCWDLGFSNQKKKSSASSFRLVGF